MRYYAVRVLCATDESREYYKVNSGDYDPQCPLDKLQSCPMRLSVDELIAYYPHSDERATNVKLKGETDNEFILALTFEKFDTMVMNGDYHTIGENKIAK